MDPTKRVKTEDTVVSIGTAPPRGEAGTPITLLANYFNLKFRLNTKVFQYAVTFTPDTHTGAKKALFKKVVTPAVPQLGPNVFDGGLLFTQNKFDDVTTEITSKNNTVYAVSITFAKEVDQEKDASTMRQLYNIIFKKMVGKLEFTALKKGLFDKSAIRPLSSGGNNRNDIRCNIWPGFNATFVWKHGGPLLNVDLTFKLMRTDNALYSIKTLMDEKNHRDAVSDALVGQSVYCAHDNRMYVIDGIEWNKTPKDTFTKTLRGGATREISFIDYFEKELTYGLRVTDRGQPLLRTSVKRRGQEAREIYLVPEFCTLTGITDDMRNNAFFMKNVADATKVAPRDRVNKLQQFVKELSQNPKARAEVEKWALEFRSTCVDLQGKHLPQEMIVFNDREFKPSFDKDGVYGWDQGIRNNSGNKFSDPGSLDRWLFLVSQRESRAVPDFIRCLRQVSLGTPIEEPLLVVEVPDDRAETWRQAFLANATPDLQLVVCLLSAKNTAIYNAVKTAMSRDKPVPTQFATMKVIQKGKLTVYTKLIQQITTKIGGRLWDVRFPDMIPTMICGIDVSKDKKQGRASVAAFVASMDRTFGRYFSKVVVQEAREQELVNSLGTCLSEALKAFYEKNQVKPERIIVYRDGVGDGQMRYVLEHEVEQFKAVFASLGINPELIYIIVQKKVNTRFVDTSNGNPLPGVVVDTHVTHHPATLASFHPSSYDFFLISQSAREGTVAPTHYHVLYHQSDWTQSIIQMLTWKLCHLYYNCTTPVRVPAPVQYAHKLSLLVGQYVHSGHHGALDKQMYYL